MKTKLSLSIFFLSLLPALAFAELSECNGVWTNDPCENPTETMKESHNPVVPKPVEPEVVSEPQPTTVINNNQIVNNPPQEDDGEGTDVQVNYGGGEYTNRRVDEGRVEELKNKVNRPVQHRTGGGRRGRR